MILKHSAHKSPVSSIFDAIKNKTAPNRAIRGGHLISMFQKRIVVRVYYFSSTVTFSSRIAAVWLPSVASF